MYVGVICLEGVFPKKYSFGLGLTEELPLPRGVKDQLMMKEVSDAYGYSDP